MGSPNQQSATHQSSAPRLSAEARFRLPGALPAGERVLWRGAPEWRALARQALHLRKLALYFGLIVAWVGVSAARHGSPAAVVASHTAIAAAIASVPLLLGLAYAWFAARNAAYTITNRRVVLRMGVALQFTLNLPFAKIDAAALTTRPDGTGAIALQLAPGSKGLGWAILWPHARPWHFGAAQPMLRALPNAAGAGHILARALAEFNDVPVMVAPETGIVDTADCHHGATPVAA